MVSPTIKSSDFPNSNTKECLNPISSPSSSSVSSRSTNSKQRTITDDSNNNDETITKIKIEDGTDEVKIFSASTIQKHEPDDDVDIDGIEDRLSPLVVEPTSPNKNDPLNNNMSGLYGSPFLHPYFHPMFQSYFMAAAAHANASGSSSDKSSSNGQANNPYGAASPSLSPFPGMPFPPLYHPGMMNQQFQSNMFNPFGIPIPTPGVRPTTSFSRQQHQSAPVYNGPPRDLNTLLDARRPKKPHIKKPLNAFMLYMKEQRAHVIEECTLKESSAINKVLGQKWKELSRTQQDRYYELAKEERNRHMQMYPSWSARDNYGIKKKRQTVIVTNNSHKKIPREYNSPHKSLTKNPVQQSENDCLNPKKCRARFGLEGQNQWCKHCRRKKKCTRFLEDDLPKHPSAHGNLSSLSSPTTTQSDDEDSMDELDSDDILSRQIDSIEDEQDDSDEENKHHKPIDSHQQQQQFYLPSSAHLYQPSVLPSHFASGFLY